jgi:hypothetical protein
MTIARREMEHHVSRSGTCLNSPLVCDFEVAGCHFTGNRQQLETHLQENRDFHLGLVMTTLATTLGRLSSVEEQSEK